MSTGEPLFSGSVFNLLFFFKNRSFSETNKFQALLNNDKFIYDGSYDKKDNDVVKKALRSALAKWDSSNPNILSLSISDGQVR
jgi:hypothetical protein